MQKLKIPPLCWLFLSIITGVIYVVGLSVYPSLVYSEFYRRLMTAAYYLFFLASTMTLGLSSKYKSIRMRRIILFPLIFLSTSGVVTGMVFLLKDIPNLLEPKVSFLYIVITIVVIIISYILVFLLDISAQYSMEYVILHEQHPFLLSCMMGYSVFVIQLSRIQVGFAGVLLLKSILSILRLWLMRWLACV